MRQNSALLEEEAGFALTCQTLPLGPSRGSRLRTPGALIIKAGQAGEIPDNLL